MSVHFACVKEGSKLRVKIVSPGYFSEANCQFPRAVRRDGRFFTAPPYAVTLAQGPGGKYFYRVAARHIRVEQEAPDVVPAAPPAIPDRVFDVSEDEAHCVICLDREKTHVFVPCGHYAVCEPCGRHPSLGGKCPLCRGAFTQLIDRALISQ